MPEESTTPDLVELVRRRMDAGDSGDADAMTSFFAPDGVWDSSPMGLEVLRGRRPFVASSKTGGGLTRRLEWKPRRCLTAATESPLQ